MPQAVEAEVLHACPCSLFRTNEELEEAAENSTVRPSGLPSQCAFAHTRLACPRGGSKQPTPKAAKAPEENRLAWPELSAEPLRGASTQPPLQRPSEDMLAFPVRRNS